LIVPHGREERGFQPQAARDGPHRRRACCRGSGLGNSIPTPGAVAGLYRLRPMAATGAIGMAFVGPPQQGTPWPVCKMSFLNGRPSGSGSAAYSTDRQSARHAPDHALFAPAVGSAGPRGGATGLHLVVLQRPARRADVGSCHARPSRGARRSRDSRSSRASPAACPGRDARHGPPDDVPVARRPQARSFSRSCFAFAVGHTLH
jgi:hypothetical protein